MACLWQYSIGQYFKNNLWVLGLSLNIMHYHAAYHESCWQASLHSLWFLLLQRVRRLFVSRCLWKESLRQVRFGKAQHWAKRNASWIDFRHLSISFHVSTFRFPHISRFSGSLQSTAAQQACRFEPGWSHSTAWGQCRCCSTGTRQKLSHVLSDSSGLVASWYSAVLAHMI